jgi:hypothetical protein
MSEPYIKVLNATDSQRCNCVKWARKFCPSLPYGLWTIWDKKKIINAKSAKKGRVAIISVGLPWGHCAVVVQPGGNHITIREANYRTCKITERHDTAKNLKILGYFTPNK